MTAVNKNGERGQAMILTVTVVMGALIGVSAITGYLMLRQIRGALVGSESVQAIFAAESGIELGLYRSFKDAKYPTSTFADPAVSFSLSVASDSIKSVGTYKSASRALQVNLATK